MPVARAYYRRRPPYTPRHQKHEENLQKMVCQYLRVQYPNIIFRSDYASGLGLSMYQARTHASLQSSRSWPDLFIAKKSWGYSGLFIELKKDGTVIYPTRGARKGQITANPHIQEQALMLKTLNSEGYFARFGVGFDRCQRIIDWYLDPNYKDLPNEELF